jgi:hypothetical protein
MRMVTTVSHFGHFPDMASSVTGRQPLLSSLPGIRGLACTNRLQRFSSICLHSMKRDRLSIYRWLKYKSRRWLIIRRWIMLSWTKLLEWSEYSTTLKAKNSLRPASQYLKKEPQQHQYDTAVEDLSSHPPLYEKGLLGLSPPHILCRARVLISIASMFSLASLFIVPEVMEKASPLLYKHMPPFESDKKETRYIETKACDREPLLAHHSSGGESPAKSRHNNMGCAAIEPTSAFELNTAET